ncbi:MAG: hypothetical protein J7J28_06185, partial [Thaumarchaeota archaeon]|nr:hypothetical protein [Nitrososphaerota archaeon]
MSKITVLRHGGLIVKTPETELWLDSARSKRDLTLISHAHSDHVPRNLGRVILTPETASILKIFRDGFDWIGLRFGECIEFRDVKISAESSGHVLGSSQFLIDSGDERFVYTGDLNVYDSIVLKGAKPIEADKLVIEATYGSPNYIFPRREEIYARIIDWIIKTIRSGEIPAFKVYALGKAQEIMKLVNTYLKVPVITSWTVSKIAEKYVDHGIRLSYLPIYSDEGLEAFSQGECVYIASKRRNPPSKRRIRWAVATGWALRYRYSGFDEAFPLSGHSDYPGLIRYVEESRPREIYVVHGFVKSFVKQLRRKGF